MLQGSDDPVMVLYGDCPWVSTETLHAIYNRLQSNGAVMTMATTIVPDFNEWREGFYSFGRIMRDADNEGYVSQIVEKKDATPEQLEIKEVNPAYMCFKSSWLWEHLSQLKNNNSQEEYYLTDLVKMAVDEDETIYTVQIDPREAVGINTKDQLALCEELAQRS
jgi:bifunctional UDP-N-acetylglucosamine pyrophosphorylase/glucosamine-1-phosphate N-acetyltransferase